MCRRAGAVLLVHYVCVDCRRAAKYRWDGAEHPCTTCRGPMRFAGHDFAAPRRRDEDGWSAVAAVLESGLSYDGWVVCGCSRAPQYRPRTGAQVRARLRAAEVASLAGTAGVGAAEALSARDVADIVDGRHGARRRRDT